MVKQLEAGAGRRLSGGMIRLSVITCAAAAMLLALPARAQDAKTPYWASIRSHEVNLRVGPGEDYKILWVYHRRHLPLKVLRMKEGWRFVQDPGGAQGWVLARLLTRERTGFITGRQPAGMREQAGSDSKLKWHLAPGVIGLVGDCAYDWCQFAAGSYQGYVEQSRIWGAGEP